jgi:hypothetical protein
MGHTGIWELLSPCKQQERKYGAMDDRFRTLYVANTARNINTIFLHSSMANGHLMTLMILSIMRCGYLEPNMFSSTSLDTCRAADRNRTDMVYRCRNTVPRTVPSGSEALP